MSENEKVDQPVEDVETLEPVDMEPAESQTEPQVEPSESEADEASLSSQPKASRLPLILSGLALVAALGSAGVAFQQDGRGQDLQSQVADLQTAVAVLNQATAPLAQIQQEMIQIQGGQVQVAEIASAVKSTSDNVSEQLGVLVTDLAETRTRLELLEGNRAQEYLLAEVEYLLRIAIQRIQAGRDVATGLSLMLSADQTLAAADDAELFPIRRALATDIAALRALPAIDRDGLYLELAAAADRIDQLSMSPIELAQAPSGEVAEGDQGLMQTLSSFITVRQRANPIDPLPTPTEAVYARQNMRLMLEQAQLALLDENSVTWQSTLERALAWADRYFLDDSEQQSLITTLARLQGLPVAQDIPRVGAALAELKALQKQRDEALGGR
ncbi:MAG: uroporphyrinogen-III C-methyltransferase [Pseudomonadales bacterium]|jgi:uroporphyrin-3 C-methyltransferase